MKISWFLPHPLPIGREYISDTFQMYRQKYGNIRFDVATGENYFGNVVPTKRIRRRLDNFFKYTKYNNTLYYLWKKKNPIDILHLQISSTFPYITTLLKSNDRPRIVITLRGSDTYCRPWIDKRFMDLYKIHSVNIEAFIVQSVDQRSYLIKFGVPDNKIFIIPSSIKNIVYPAKKIIKGQKINIMSAFRFVWEKNITGNLLFIKKLKSQYSNIKYNIYGDGCDMAQIYYLIDRFDIGDIVKVNNFLSNEQLLNKYLENDYYLQLSISESGSVTVKEAQRCGLLPIVSKVGGFKDLVHDGETGIIKDFTDYENLINDTINIHQNPKLYNNISGHCINNIKNNYNTGLEVQRLYNLYKKILNSK